METSDSEYFESADEDFQSDDEDTKTVKSVTKTEDGDVQCTNATVEKLKEVKIAESKVETDLISLNNNKNNENRRTESVEKDGENNISKSETSTKNVDNEAKPVQESVEIRRRSERGSSVESGDVSGEEDLWGKSEMDWGSDKGEKGSTGDKVEENLWDEAEIDWGKENEENMWDNEDWEPVEEPQGQIPRPQEQKSQPRDEIPHSKEKSQPQDKIACLKEKTQQPEETASSSWSSWGNWGVSSIISTASQSVSTITQGISTALESGIGVPDPEEMARMNRAEKEKSKEVGPDDDADRNTGFGLGNLVMGVSHLTKLVETTGTKVISGGLDTLETIGKKTMEVLQEGDPGLKKKRAFLKIDQDKPVLSQLLREAKEKAETENRILERQHFAKKAKNYETLFDDHQGLVHLEALEMLSKQCDIKLQTLLESYTDDALVDMQETMDQVKELCELPDEDEEEQVSWSEIDDKLKSAVSEINVPISYKKLIDTWEETESWLNTLKLEVCDERELHQQAIEALAQLTAIAVEQFHKAGELLLVKEHRSTADEADSLVQ
jgi:hypothetical protein